jgi:hypothetical protein
VSLALVFRKEISYNRSKQQAASSKQQAASSKQQAASSKQQAASSNFESKSLSLSFLLFLCALSGTSKYIYKCRQAFLSPDNVRAPHAQSGFEAV